MDLYVRLIILHNLNKGRIIMAHDRFQAETDEFF